MDWLVPSLSRPLKTSEDTAGRAGETREATEILIRSGFVSRIHTSAAYDFLMSLERVGSGGLLEARAQGEELGRYGHLWRLLELRGREQTLSRLEIRGTHAAHAACLGAADLRRWNGITYGTIGFLMPFTKSTVGRSASVPS